VTEETGTEGRIVKGLGDGYMLAFGDPRDAVDAAWRIIVRHRDGEGPGVHASLHQGVAVVRDGDYFGGVVNVAARILAAAKRDELVATEPVAEATDSDFHWEHAGASFIRGVRDTVDLYQLIGPRRSANAAS
jgi:adenylate cyclase